MESRRRPQLGRLYVKDKAKAATTGGSVMTYAWLIDIVMAYAALGLAAQ